MPKNRYPVPSGFHRSEIEVQRSRFIASVKNAESADAALAFITRIKQEFPDANHNCWAYLIGPPGSSDRLGLSDDGEPHGAAGKPMLTVLQHSGVGDIAVVVSRYFGGIKLGKGGMVKAYTHAVQTALEQLETVEKISWRKLWIGFDYSLMGKIEQVLPDFEANIFSREFAEQVSLQLKFPAEREKELRRVLNDLTAGNVRFPDELQADND